MVVEGGRRRISETVRDPRAAQEGTLTCDRGPGLVGVDALAVAARPGHGGQRDEAHDPRSRCDEREALAADIGAGRDLELTPANIVVQPGGKPVITTARSPVASPRMWAERSSSGTL